jgi:hypothetical protein
MKKFKAVLKVLKRFDFLSEEFSVKHPKLFAVILRIILAIIWFCAAAIFVSGIMFETGDIALTDFLLTSDEVVLCVCITVALVVAVEIQYRIVNRKGRD